MIIHMSKSRNNSIISGLCTHTMHHHHHQQIEMKKNYRKTIRNELSRNERRGGGGKEVTLWEISFVDVIIHT